MDGSGRQTENDSDEGERQIGGQITSVEAWLKRAFQSRLYDSIHRWMIHIQCYLLKIASRVTEFLSSGNFLYARFDFQ